MSQFLDSGKKLPFMKVPFDQLPWAIVQKIARSLIMSWIDYPDWFSRRPSTVEYAEFRQWVADRRRDIDAPAASNEDACIQAKIVPEWEGSVLKVGERKWEYSPVPHHAEHTLDPYDESIVVAATMLLKADNQGEIVKAYEPAVVKDGPVASIMTPSSVTKFQYVMGTWLQSKGANSPRPEIFSNQIYEAVAKEPRTEKAALRRHLYDLFAPMDIKADSVTKTLTLSDKFSVKVLGADVVAGRSGAKITVPRLQFEKIKSKIDYIPVDAKSKEKDPVENLLRQVASRFPNRLTHYHGYRGCPGRNQRLFMTLRPFLNHCCLVDPSVVISQWMRANGLESHIRTLGNTYSVSGDLTDDDIPIVMQDYKKGFNQTRNNCIFYGEVEFGSAFWSQYKIVVYRPSVEGKFFFCKQSLDLDFLPDVAYGWKKEVVCNGGEMCSHLATLAAQFTAMMFKMTYAAKGAQYADLKYPIELKKFSQVEIQEMPAEDKVKVSSVARASLQTFSLDFDEPVERDLAPDKPALDLGTSLRATATVSAGKLITSPSREMSPYDGDWDPNTDLGTYLAEQEPGTPVYALDAALDTETDKHVGDVVRADGKVWALVGFGDGRAIFVDYDLAFAKMRFVRAYGSTGQQQIEIDFETVGDD